MRCIECNVSMFDKPLHRTNPTGQADAGWMCKDCIKENEPELYDNLKFDGHFKIINDIAECTKSMSKNIPVLYNFFKYDCPRIGLFSVPKKGGKYNLYTGWENNIVKFQIIGEDSTSYVYELKEIEEGIWKGNKVIRKKFMLPIGIHKSRLVRWVTGQLELFNI